MKLSKLKKAVEASERFQAAAKAAAGEHVTRFHRWHTNDPDAAMDNIDTCPKEQGALRRASLELTRALADLRRPTP